MKLLKKKSFNKWGKLQKKYYEYICQRNCFDKKNIDVVEQLAKFINLKKK